MTETSPIGSLNVVTPELRQAPVEERLSMQVRQGRRIFGVDWRIVDEDGKALPHDGEAIGEFQVRGPWVCSSYYEHDEELLGWIRTDHRDAHPWAATRASGPPCPRAARCGIP